MNNVVGRPGTRSSLVLRVSQLVCAAASLVAIGNAYSFTSYTAFFYLSCSMFLQLLESLVLGCVDIVCLATNSDVHDNFCVFIILICDWCIAILSLSAATASAGVTVLFKRDTHFCRGFPQLTCGQYELAVVLAFVAWSFIAASALSLFWFWVSLLGVVPP